MAVSLGPLPPRRPARGAALAMVLVVVTLLSIMGVFALRSAGMSVRSAGYAREASQARHLADLGARGVAAKIGAKNLRFDASKTGGAGDVIGSYEDDTSGGGHAEPCLGGLGMKGLDSGTFNCAVLFPEALSLNSSAAWLELTEAPLGKSTPSFLAEVVEDDAGSSTAGEEAGSVTRKRYTIFIDSAVNPAPAGAGACDLNGAKLTTKSRARITIEAPSE